MLKEGQTIWFYYSKGDFMGEIVQAHIVGIMKDLVTKKISYNVKKDSLSDFFPTWMNDYSFTLMQENIYSSYDKIVKEYKDEIAYNALRTRMDDLEKTLNTIVKDYAQPIKLDSLNGKYMTITGSEIEPVSIKVDGIGDLKEEFEKIKKDVEKLKKNIKPKTKKAYTTKEKESNK